MRRKNASISYKTDTENIVKNRFEPWQLTYKDTREGIHSLINRTVSYTEELNNELDYVTNKFLITRADLAEEYVLYKTTHGIDELFDVDGNPIDLPNSNDVDNLISGDFDKFEVEEIIKTDYNVKDIIGNFRDELYTYDGSIIRKHNIESDEHTQLESFYNDIKSDEFVSDINNKVYVFNKPVTDISVKLNGNPVPFEFITQDNSPLYISTLDTDSNHVITPKDIEKLKSALGKNDKDPDWLEYSVFDIDGNGYINTEDLNKANESLYAISQSIWGAVIVPENITGILQIVYSEKIKKPVSIKYSNDTYSMMFLNDLTENYVDYYIYDDKTDMYCGFKEEDLLLFKMNEDNITSHTSINMPYWSADCKIYDLDLVNGLLFVIFGTDTKRQFGYVDIWQESAYELTHYFDLDIIINTITYLPENRLVAGVDNYIYVLKPKRNRYFEVDNYTFFNTTHELYLEDNSEVKLLPHFVWNSFDSIGYNIGLERPLGYNNVQFREIIYDWGKFIQSNSRKGMIYGINRDLGFLNEEITFRKTIALSNTLAMDETIEVNGNDYTLNGDVYEYNTSRIYVYNNKFIRTENIEFPINIKSNFIDGNGNPVYMEIENITIVSGQITNVNIFSHSSEEYLERNNYLVDGNITNEFINTIRIMDNTHPGIYKNIESDRTVFDCVVFPYNCVCPTVYNKDVIIENEEEFEF